MNDLAQTPDPAAGDHRPSELTPEEARGGLLGSATPVTGTERLALRQALGRVAAAQVVSPLDVPGHVNSAMDGYALRHADVGADPTRLRVVGTALAGSPYPGIVGVGEAVRIMTGAVVPEGADTVVMQESVQRQGDGVVVAPGLKAGANVRLPGEDLRRGEEVFGPGTVLGPAQLGLLASLGVPEVAVYRRVRAAFFSTGDELRSVGETLAEGDVYDSNRYTLHGMLTQAGADVIDMGVVPDRPEAIARAFTEAAACADIVLTSGGVSVGEADHVKDVLARLGRIDFWRIRMKPGRPLAFGHLDPALFFGLPGNPVAVMVSFYQFVLPVLRRLQGRADTTSLQTRARSLSGLKKRPGRVEFQRGILRWDATGEACVETTGAQGSGVLRSMHSANCFIVLPLECEHVAPGDEVTVQPFCGFG